MSRRRKLTDTQVAALPAKATRYTHADPELGSHYVRVFPSGAKSFVVVKQNKWTTIGDTKVWTIEKAREKARAILRNESTPDSVEEVVQLYYQKRVADLRTARTVESYLDIIKREFAGREFSSVKRGELIRLAEKTAERSGNRAAEYLLVTFGSLSRWHALRTEDYSSPVVRGMTKDFHGKARSRIFTDEEVRKVWKEAERRGDNFGALVRLLLLSGQRREKVASVKWTDLNGATWTIATEEREKGNGGELVLPEAALAIINARPRMGSNPYVLATRGGAHFCAFGREKRKFDVAVGFSDFTLHDLRRTARSLMARAGVLPHIAERTLGHAITGVEGTYDRHSYSEEKAQALRMLAGQIETIVNPPTGANITPLRKVS
jgi:integrase